MVDEQASKNEAQVREMDAIKDKHNQPKGFKKGGKQINFHG